MGVFFPGTDCQLFADLNKLYQYHISSPIQATLNVLVDRRYLDTSRYALEVYPGVPSSVATAGYINIAV